MPFYTENAKKFALVHLTRCGCLMSLSIQFMIFFTPFILFIFLMQYKLKCQNHIAHSPEHTCTKLDKLITTYTILCSITSNATPFYCVNVRTWLESTTTTTTTKTTKKKILRKENKEAKPSKIKAKQKEIYTQPHLLYTRYYLTWVPVTAGNPISIRYAPRIMSKLLYTCMSVCRSAII